MSINGLIEEAEATLAQQARERALIKRLLDELRVSLVLDADARVRREAGLQAAERMRTECHGALLKALIEGPRHDFADLVLRASSAVLRIDPEFSLGPAPDSKEARRGA